MFPDLLFQFRLISIKHDATLALAVRIRPGPKVIKLGNIR